MAKKIKVSQKTIDSIKKLGMTEALKLAGKNGNPAGGLASEYQEGIRRMYGAKRLAAAKAKYTPAAKSPDAARAGLTKPKAVTKPATKPMTKPAAKSNTKSNVVKATLGTAAAVGAVALSKGKAVGLASKLSPSVGKLAKSGVGKALFGTGEKLTTKGTAMAGRMTAKAGKPVSQTQYEAMQAAAKAKGIKLSGPDAARAGATAAAKKKAASTVTKKKAAGASGASNKKNK